VPVDLGCGFRASSAKGLTWQDASEKIVIRVGGRVQWDYGWYSGDDLREAYGLRLENNEEFRRIRTYISGTFDEVFDFKFQLEYHLNYVGFKDVYVTFKSIPFIGNIRVGHFQEPFSLDEMTSSKYATFIERGLPNAFAPGRSWGVMAFNHVDQRATWAVGVYKNWIDDGDFGRWGSSGLGQSTSLTGRVTYLPFYEDKGRRLVHVGASGSMRWPEEPVRYRARPEAHFLDSRFTDTRSIDADRLGLLGTEAAFVCGPFHGETEYVAAAINGEGSYEDQWLHGLYVQGGYFLTGETRPYDTKKGVFKVVQPKKNFVSGGGPGAWETAIRYSYLELDGPGLSSSARDMHDMTLGVNWYLNKNVRVSWNWVHSWVNGVGTVQEADMFIMRLQLFF